MKLDVKKLRKKMGLTQTELAQLLGTSAVYISMVEGGKSRLNDFQFGILNGINSLGNEVLKTTKDLILEGGYLFALARLLNEVFKKGK